MRFGKRAGNFREPMRFGKKSSASALSSSPVYAAFLEELSKRNFREPMRFGKKASNSPNSIFSAPSSEDMSSSADKRAEFREPMRFGKRLEGADGGKQVGSGGEVVGPVMSDEGIMSLEAPWIGPLVPAEPPLFGSLVLGEENSNSSSD